MKKIIVLPTLLCIVFLFNCSSSDNENDLPALDVSECNQLAFDAYQNMIEVGLEFNQNPTTSNCIALREAAQNVKNIFIQCNLWEDEEGNIQDEIEEIINREC